MNKNKSPWGLEGSMFDYNQPLFDVAADMTLKIVPYLLKVVYKKTYDINYEEIRDEIISNVTLDLNRNIKCWKPVYDLYSFVMLRCRFYTRETLKLKKYSASNFFDFTIFDTDVKLKLQTETDINYRKTKYKSVDALTSKQFDKLMTELDEKDAEISADIVEAGSLQAYYLGENCH